MLLQFTSEQDDLRRSLRRFLADRSPSAEVRRLMETDEGVDPAVWAQLAGQLGVVALGIPEAYGGAGGGQVERTVVFEEAGRGLLCGPLLSSLLATEALLRSGDGAACGELLPGIADGTTVATLAPCGLVGAWSLDHLPVSWADGTLSGTASLVLDGLTADVVLVVAAGPDGPSLYAVTEGLQRKGLQTLDLTRKLASVSFDGAPARLVGAAGGVGQWLPGVLAVGRTCLVAEQVGGAQWCLDASVEYAKLRYQFNRPVGSFQQVKARLADMLLAVENARSAAYYAAWTVDTDEAARTVPLASAVCAEAYRSVAADCIQVHGGIGFTWEHDAHLYYRRAGASALQFGEAGAQWSALADQLLA